MAEDEKQTTRLADAFQQDALRQVLRGWGCATRGWRGVGSRRGGVARGEGLPPRYASP